MFSEIFALKIFLNSGKIQKINNSKKLRLKKIFLISENFWNFCEFLENLKIEKKIFKKINKIFSEKFEFKFKKKSIFIKILIFLILRFQKFQNWKKVFFKEKKFFKIPTNLLFLPQHRPRIIIKIFSPNGP